MRETLHGEYAEWRARREPLLRGDPMWRMSVYRLARFTADRAWVDIRRLGRDVRTRECATQLCRALGKVPANLAEGYSRSSGADRVRLYEYALGSIRESREWYLSGEPVLGPERTRMAMALLTRLCRILLSIIPRERTRLVRKTDPPAAPNPGL